VVSKLAVVFVAILCAADIAAAQGRGNAFGKGRKGGTVSSGGSTADGTAASGGTIAGTAVREFGTWLDDASLADPGSGWVGVSFGTYSSTGGRQTDFPVFDAAIGLTHRIQVGMTVPSYSRFSAADGTTFGSRGDIYVNSKISILNRLNASRPSALAVTPLVEILSQPDPRDGGRIFWGLPVSAEMRLDSFRVYGSTGVFSRGAWFAGGAVETPVTDRVIVTGALNFARSIIDAPVADAEGLSSSRVDLTGSAVYVMTPKVAVFGSLGRTLSRIDANSSTMVLNGGLAISFASSNPSPPSRRP
jgi:hypothetical protein